MSLKTEIFKKLRSYGFSKVNDPNDKRLGIEMNLITDDSKKYIEIYHERQTYYQIFFYGISERYLPITVDILDIGDLKEIDKILK